MIAAQENATPLLLFELSQSECRSGNFSDTGSAGGLFGDLMR